MAMDDNARRFASTRWSLVLAAGRGSAPGARDALGALCEAYWYPVYAYVRRRGHPADDAADLTQAFFARLLEKGDLRAANPERGRFRAFLLASVGHFLSNERDRALAQKRGGGAAVISLDGEAAERRYALEPSHDLTPERVYERRWALELLGRALARLRAGEERSGRGGRFEALKGHLTGEGGSYAETAVAIGTSESAVKVAVHRLRRRYRELVRAEIAETLDDPSRVDDELGALFAALGS